MVRRYHSGRHLPPIKFPASSLTQAALAGIPLVTPAFAVENIDYASIGNAGNANDAATGSFYSADITTSMLRSIIRQSGLAVGAFRR